MGKNKWIAFLLAFFLGLAGAHKFYEGKIGMGIAYLLISTAGAFLTAGITLYILEVVVFVECIMYLFKSNPYNP